MPRAGHALENRLKGNQRSKHKRYPSLVLKGHEKYRRTLAVKVGYMQGLKYHRGGPSLNNSHRKTKPVRGLITIR